MTSNRASDGDAAIEVQDLRKTYGDFEAVAGIDLRVERGEIFALLGPNGAGKTTATEILEGHRNRTSGDVRVLGYDPERGDTAFKQRIGIVLQETGVEPYLTVEETLDMFRSFYPHPRSLDEVLMLVGLTEQRDVRVKKLSGGQQRRLDVGIGLAGDPDLLFLDEPTTGFDPAARRGAWDMVRGLQSLGKTIFLTTHYMEEAQVLADRVAIIQRGRIIAQGTPASLIEAEPESTIRFREPADVETLLRGIENIDRGQPGYVTILTPKPTEVLYILTSRAHDLSSELAELSVSHGSLETTYLRLVGEEGSD
ncbi:MAG TPA: ABC transporter ATP-binding protein [Dehalococcoidia bacterium]|nr:ABC transporter ATP-binding protein [Dehalococcoidia bacterium]